MLPSRYFSELTQPEIAAQLKTNPLVILPAGSVEQHGPHLPTGTDTFAATVISHRVAGRRIGVEHEGLACDQHGRAVGEAADPQLRSLQVDQDSDRAAMLGFDRADRRHQLAHAVVRGVAHIDAEDVGAGPKQARDHVSVGGGGAERGDDLGPTLTSHQFLLREGGAGVPGRPAAGGVCSIGTRDCRGCIGTSSADSVSWTVHDGWWPVSTSKKPVRS